MVIAIAGMIGLGKSTTAKTLHDALGMKIYHESVEGNKFLPLFYTASEEEQMKNRYPFLLQLNFLTTRYHAIKEALNEDNAILDRSIYEDRYFAKKVHEQGRISDLEYGIYEELLNEMLHSTQYLKKKAPDLMIYLKGSFDTVLRRIKERGNDYEQDSSLVDYYRFLWSDYDSFVKDLYHESPVLVVDMDEKDVNFNDNDRNWLIEKVKEYLN